MEKNGIDNELLTALMILGKAIAMQPSIDPERLRKDLRAETLRSEIRAEQTHPDTNYSLLYMLLDGIAFHAIEHRKATADAQLPPADPAP